MSTSPTNGKCGTRSGGWSCSGRRRAIGVAAAFGVYLGVRDVEGSREQLFERLVEVVEYLGTSRPTAVNLFWALGRMRRIAGELEDPALIKERLLDEAVSMIEEDNRVCRAIGEHGATLLEQFASEGETIELLTHCNAGGLATVKYGTALAPIYVGAERGMRFHVWADETRPLLQGSRITAFELKQNGIPVTVICDGMAASVMREQAAKSAGGHRRRRPHRRQRRRRQQDRHARRRSPCQAFLRSFLRCRADQHYRLGAGQR